MTYVAANYTRHRSAPEGQWVCAPTSRLGPLTEAPSGAPSKGPDFCGQCVSYVKTVCPILPATTLWTKGDAVKGATDLIVGTVIATFNDSGDYEGHAAIYAGQSVAGISVWDQYMTPPTPKGIGPRLLRFGARGRANDGDAFYVVE